MPARILVVDDEADLELLITQRFRREIRRGEYSFRFAANGAKALEIIDGAEEIDLVLTDINMPMMDGLTLLGKIKERKSPIQAVVISAYGDMKNIRTAMNRGAFDFLIKPIDFEDLKITMNRTLERVAELKEMARVRREKDQARQHALEQERRAQKAQAELIAHLQMKDKLKDEFLAMTSHELRTPLNGIIGLAESLMDGAAGHLDQRVINNLQMMASSGRRLSRLVDDILDFSHMRTGDLALVRVSLNLRAAAESVFLLTRAAAERKGLALQNRIPAGLPPVLADPNRLQQILLNLVTNAIKFTENGAISLSAEREDDRIVISVSDTGMGIAEEMVPRIFKMFEQLDQTDTRKQGGLGLGLAITKNLVERHGATLEVSSIPGSGSRFYFSLPVSSDAPQVGMQQTEPLTPEPELPRVVLPPAPEGMAGEEGYDILVVDDEPVNLQVLANHLSQRNDRVTLAGSGQEALALIGERSRFDLVILDVMMPGMNGFEVCRFLREKFSLYELPILLLTARNQVKDFVEGLEAGANDYLSKPFDKLELFARINTLVSLKQAVATAMQHQHDLRDERVRALTLQNEKAVLTHMAEASARAEAQAREVSRQKTDFLALMSHELRTPLNAIIGYAEMLQEDLEEVGSDGMVRDILKIQNAARSLLMMINQLLDMSKIEAGKMDLYLEDVSLPILFEEIEGIIRPLADQNGNRLNVALDASLQVIHTDGTKLRQILINLLGNACKFTSNGQIDLSGVPTSEGGEPWLRLAVHDSGIGMNEEQQQRLFQPFMQAEKSTTRKFGGTGLGLTIVKRFCDMIQGRVRIESEPDRGTVFIIELPLDCR